MIVLSCGVVMGILSNVQLSIINAQCLMIAANAQISICNAFCFVLIVATPMNLQSNKLIRDCVKRAIFVLLIPHGF